MPFVYEHRCQACGFSAKIVDGAPGVAIGDEIRELPWPDAHEALAAMPDAVGAPRVNIERYWCLDCGAMGERVRDIHPQPWAGCGVGIVLGALIVGGLAQVGLTLATGSLTIALVVVMVAPIIHMQRLESKRHTWRSEIPCGQCGGRDLLRPRDCPEDLPCPSCGQPGEFHKLARVGPLAAPGRDYTS